MKASRIIITDQEQVAALKLLYDLFRPNSLDWNFNKPGQASLPSGAGKTERGRPQRLIHLNLPLLSSAIKPRAMKDDFLALAVAGRFKIPLKNRNIKRLVVDPSEVAALRAFYELNHLVEIPDLYWVFTKSGHIYGNGLEVEGGSLTRLRVDNRSIE